MMRWLMMSLVLSTACGCGGATGELWQNVVLPEPRTIAHRETSDLPSVPIPANSAPRTVFDPRPETPDWRLSLDEAIRIALERARVIRVLTGVTATASGQTIYDAAITHTTIDQALARFDAVLTQNNQWSRPNAPSATNDFTDLSRSDLFSTPVDSYQSTLSATKTNVVGGQLGLTYIENPIRYPNPSVANPLFPGLGFPLNPQTTRSVALNYTQPLLQGGGYRVNMAPVVIARLNTEVSFFQYKDSVQEMVRGVCEAYWSLVQAHTEAAARKQQVDVTRDFLEREEARLKAKIIDDKDVALVRVTYNLFRANEITAKALVLTREGALRNILGLPPNDDPPRRIIPANVPNTMPVRPDWDALVRLAEQRRPDIIELKIIIEAEQQRLLQAENQMLPTLNAVAQYRWNGLSGTMPNGEFLTTGPTKFTDWTLGVNFSIPLGLRQARAMVRQEKLLIERDRANLNQALHAAIHELTATVQDRDSAYEQYHAYKVARAAAETNQTVQQARVGAKLKTSFDLEMRQAILDLADATISEGNALLAYNVALANLERRTGTILETHGLVFNEERFRAAGPLLHGRLYPSATVPAVAPPVNLDFEKLEMRPKFLAPVVP